MHIVTSWFSPRVLHSGPRCLRVCTTQRSAPTWLTWLWLVITLSLSTPQTTLCILQSALHMPGDQCLLIKSLLMNRDGFISEYWWNGTAAPSGQQARAFANRGSREYPISWLCSSSPLRRQIINQMWGAGGLSVVMVILKKKKTQRLLLYQHPRHQDSEVMALWKGNHINKISSTEQCVSFFLLIRCIINLASSKTSSVQSAHS